MPPFSSFLRITVRRLVLPLTCLIACAPFALSQACTTSITGKVYSPNGPTTGDPIPNILVFVPAPGYPPPTFSQGIAGGCAVQSTLVPAKLLVSTTTAFDGSFTLTSPDLAGTNVPIVIQAGKWRAQLVVPTVTACATTQFSASMPAATGPGVDLPHIAVVTGGADGIECIFHKIGIANSEFTDPSGSGSINLFEGAAVGGAVINPLASHIPSEADLVETPATLSLYDLVMFGCQGTAADSIATRNTNGALNNLVDYANNGGRIFATHFGYVWLDNIQPFASSANWSNAVSYQSANNVTLPATIDTSYPEGAILSKWLQVVGASYNNIPGKIGLQNVRVNTSGVNSPPSQSWVTLDPAPNGVNYPGTPVMQFTFDTPINGAATPTVSVTFANTPATFLVGDTSDSIVVTTTNNSAAPADNSLNLTLSLPAGLTRVSLAGVGPSTGWICSVNTLVCNRTTSLPAGASDAVKLVVSVPPTATLGAATIDAVIAGGNLSNTSQCGRVLYNDYHVESGASTGSKYPAECSGTSLTPQEKFLEFSLYNLSNFVAPHTSDLVTIQSPTTTQITSLVSPIFYGQIIGFTNGINAIVSTTAPQGPGNGSLLIYVDGTLVCTLLNDASQGPCPNAGFSGQHVGPHTIYATYSGNALYAASTSPTYTVIVQPDPTTAQLGSRLNPATVGQSVTLTAQIGDIYTTATGSVNFFDGTTLLGSGTLDATGLATFTTSTLAIGIHFITVDYPTSLDFIGSSAGPIDQIIVDVPHPVPSFMTLASSLNPSILKQNVTFTATVSSSGALVTIPTGSVTFLDGTTVLGTGTLNSVGIATYSTTSLALGSHNITAAYAGTTLVAPSTSALLVQIVNQGVPPITPGFLLNITPGTMSIGVGHILAARVVVAPLSGFAQDVTLSCADLPAETTCTFAKPVITGANGSTTLDITTIAPHDCGGSAPYFNSTSIPYTAPVLAGLIFFLVPRRRRALKKLILMALAICLLPALTGCSHCTDLGTIPADYTIKVIGTAPDMTVTQSIPFTVHL